jgi:RHS repeat-associated protein
MDKIENYFDLTTRRQIDTDTLVGHSTITAKEYMIYGSERVGAHHRNELIKDVETEYYIYLSNPENVWSASSKEYSPRVYDSIYMLHRGEKRYAGSNHLGNVLVTYSDKRLQTCTNDTIHFYKADLRSATDYYPFGMMMPGRNWYSGTDSLLRFGFGGHQREDEMKGLGNWYDFGDYGYDPRLGRRPGLDPLQTAFPWQSPYSAFDNNPVSRIDPTGQSALDYKAGHLLDEDNRNFWQKSKDGFLNVFRKRDLITVPKQTHQVDFTRVYQVMPSTSYSGTINQTYTNHRNPSEEKPELASVGFQFNVDSYMSNTSIVISRKNFFGKEKEVFRSDNVIRGQITTPLYKSNRLLIRNRKEGFNIRIEYEQVYVPPTIEDFEDPDGNITRFTTYVVVPPSSVSYTLYGDIKATDARLEELKKRRHDNVVEK